MKGTSGSPGFTPPKPTYGYGGNQAAIDQQQARDRASGNAGGFTRKAFTAARDAYNQQNRVPVQRVRPVAKAPAAPGVLATPGEGEQWWASNKERLSQPSIMSGKGYTEQLFESGNQGLNTAYDRERNKRQTRLEDQMSAMGVFGSSDTMKGMWELEAELGAQQARDMQGLAGDADAAKSTRDRQMLDRDRTVFGMAGDTQDMFQNRERMPLQDRERLAGKYSDIFRSMEGASNEEQAQLKESIIQSIIAEGGMDYAAASQTVDELMQAAGIVIRHGGYGSGSSSPAPTNTDGVLPPTFRT